VTENHIPGNPAEKQSRVPLATVIKRIIWLCILPLFLFAACLAIYDVGVIHRQQTEQAASLAENLVLATDNALNSRIKALSMLAMSPLVNDLSRWHDLYREAQGFYQSFGTHVVISNGGTPVQLLLNTRVPFGTPLPVVEKPNGRLAGPIAMRTGKPAVSDLFAGPVAHKLLLGIAVPVLRQGTAKYAIVTTIDQHFFQKLMDQVALPSGWSMVLKDAQGAKIARRPRGPIKDPAASFVANSHVSHWTVIVAIPYNAYWRPLASVAVALGAILIGVTLAGFLGGKWAGRRLGRSVASLTQTPPPGTPPPDILEIAAARHLLDDEAQRRATVETTLRESEAALQEKVLEYGAMFERSAVGKAQADPLTGRFLKVNQAFADMTGYVPAELRQMTFAEITHPDDRGGGAMGGVPARAGGADKWQIEKRYVKKDGSVIWVNVSGNLIHFDDGRPARTIAVIQDVTERKLAEAALRESELRFRLALRNAPVSVAAQDRNLRYIWAFNQRTATPEAIIGHFDEEIFIPEEAEHVTAIKRRVLEENIELREQMWFNRPSGRIFLDTCWEPIRDQSGRVSGVASATVDLTPIKLAEEALKSSLAEKEVLLKEIHHRVKNNMQVISSLVDLQADEVKDAAMRDIFKDVIYRVRSMAMVHEILYQSADLARVEFADYTRSLLGYLWRAHGAAACGAQLSLDLEPVSLPVNAAVPCGLILNELFSNALKHAFTGRDGGQVTVSLRADADGNVRISVHDNGIGLPAELDWETTRSLGLRLVKMLSGQLHATVEVAIDEGTRFMITFKESKP
jgi:PAS domain S-box-containing protein